MKLPQELILKQMRIGPLDNYIYFIGDAQTKQVAVVDPAWDANALIKEADKNGYTIVAALLTHGHTDHVNALEKLLAKLKIPVYLSIHEAHFYVPKIKGLLFNKENEKIKIGNIEIECVYTPGHTPGCQCFKYKNILLTGDTLFVDGCGRTDLPGGDAKLLSKTLQEIMAFPNDTLIFPGHEYGPVPYAPLGDLKQTNPYLGGDTLSDFVDDLT